MNLGIIGWLIRTKRISPALGRLVEGFAWALALYALGAVAEGKPLSAAGAAAAMLGSPVMQSLAKARRDKNKR
jgi:hypothetical protein